VVVKLGELDPCVKRRDKGEWESSWEELDPCIERRWKWEDKLGW